MSLAPVRSLVALAAVIVASLSVVGSAAGEVFQEAVADSGYAPDLGWTTTWVASNGSVRTLTVATGVGHSDLGADEDIYWHLDTAPGGEPLYGAEYAIQLDGYVDQPDIWRTYTWDGVQWQPFAFDGFTLNEYIQEIRWTAPFIVTPPQPDALVTINLRTESVRANTWRDTAPNVGLAPYSIVLNGSGGAPCLSCVRPQIKPNATGSGQSHQKPVPPPPPPPPQCPAKRILKSVQKDLRAAKKARARAHRPSVRRRHARTVKRLAADEKRLKKVVRTKC